MNSPSEIAATSKVFEPTEAIERNTESPPVASRQGNVAPIADRTATVSPLKTPIENDSPQFELFGWNVRWNPSSKVKPISPPSRLTVRNFGYYFPKERLYLENFDDWHAQCGSDELSHFSSVKLNKRRNDVSGKTTPNEMLLKIAHAQIMDGNLVDAAKTLDLIAPVMQSGESADSNMAQRHDVRRGDELRSEYYLKDRSLRYLARLQADRQVDEAVKSALKISYPFTAYGALFQN